MNEYEKKNIEELYERCRKIEKPAYSDDSRSRDAYQRDYARIMYSSSFRRLQGKMQLLSIHSAKFHRNRLTHSLEVSQIARGIISNLKKTGCEIYTEDDVCVVEAASLAHDLGNPPFGHSGEKVLNALMQKDGGFEGNAQTLRILRHIELKSPDFDGLDLSKRTILSVVKYSNSRRMNKSKFLYDEDFDHIKHLFTRFGYTIGKRTLDAQIMDLADEIAYAAHDLEDSLRMKLFSFDDIIYEFEKDNSGKKDHTIITKLNEIYDIAKQVASKGNKKSSEFYNTYLIKEITSNVVNSLIIDIGYSDVTNELTYLSLRELAKGLKKLTFKCVKRSNDVLLYEKKGQVVIEGLFEALIDNKFNKDNHLLPMEYQYLSAYPRKRIVADYIAGMMDLYAEAVYKKIYGVDVIAPYNNSKKSKILK